MSDLETTQSKLRSTPTAGVAGEHSAYYRRLLSAGYKGYIQGSIGGATLYGALGLAVGAAVAFPALLIPGVNTAVLLLIPAISGFGVLHGASTFSDIGKTAAIIAESADTNEKRRYLLDRYYETPSDEEAKAIKQLLENQLKPEVPEQMFHWKTVLVGALLGLAITAGFMLLAPHLAAMGTEFALYEIAKEVATAGAASTLLVGAGVGTLAGGLIGLDREYVRRWLDHSENLVNDQSRSEKQLAAREREIQSLSTAATRDFKNMPARVSEAERAERRIAPEAVAPAPTKIAPLAEAPGTAASRPDPISPRSIAGLSESPEPKVSAAQLQSRVASLQEALARPVL